MLKEGEVAPFLRKKTVRFADDESLLFPPGRSRLLPGLLERRISRGRRLRLPGVLLRLLPLLLLVVLATALLVRSSSSRSLRRHTQPVRTGPPSYIAWLARLDPETAEAAQEQRTVLFRGEEVRFNDSAPAFALWPADPDCRHFVTRFTNQKELPLVALLSLPGSGATWLRYLIEGSTGIFTGSAHHYIELYDKGLLGELAEETDGSTIIQQTHRGPHIRDKRREADDSPLQLQFKLPKVVVLMRNPYRALIHARALEGGYRDQLPPSSLVRGGRWHQFVHMQLQQWHFKLQLALGITERAHILHYEELQEDTESALLPLLDFLELSAPDPARLDCLRSHKDGPTRRADDASVVAQYAFSEPEIRATVDKHIELVDELLQEHGDRLPVEKYELYGGRGQA